MHAPADLYELQSVARSRVQLLTNGMTDRKIQSAVRSGHFIKPWHGWYARSNEWSKLSPEQQHLVRALCAKQRSSKILIFSHATAAALLGLPLLRFDTSKVHTLQPPTNTSPSDRGVIRHSQSFLESDVDRSGSLTCTNLVRTVVDIARYDRFAQAVVVGDAALHRAAQRGSRAAEALRSSFIARLSELPGTRGHRRAQNVLRFLDAGAESPLESLYRLQFSRLGFDVRSQVPVPGPRGSTYRMDLELVGEGVFFEADGKVKYTDESRREGKSLEQVLIEERNREAWVRSRLTHRVLRGEWKSAQSVEATAALLREFEVAPRLDHRARPARHLW